MGENISETQQNLWHIANRDHLLSCLMDSKKKFVVLTLVLMNEDDSVKVMLRKHIKEKSKIYKNIIFLYYPLKKDDFGKIWELLPNDEASYPRIYHLYDVDKMLGEVWNLKDKSKLVESEFLFKKFHKYYIDFDPHSVKEEEQKSSSQSNQNNKDVVDENIEEHYDEDICNISGNEIGGKQNNQTEEVYKPDIATERKKLIEKIKFIQQSGEEFKTLFIKDIQKRKQKEKKRKEKENGSENTKEQKLKDKEKKRVR